MHKPLGYRLHIEAPQSPAPVPDPPAPNLGTRSEQSGVPATHVRAQHYVRVGVQYGATPSGYLKYLYLFTSGGMGVGRVRDGGRESRDGVGRGGMREKWKRV